MKSNTDSYFYYKNEKYTFGIELVFSFFSTNAIYVFQGRCLPNIAIISVQTDD